MEANLSSFYSNVIEERKEERDGGGNQKIKKKRLTNCSEWVNLRKNYLKINFHETIQN